MFKNAGLKTCNILQTKYPSACILQTFQFGICLYVMLFSRRQALEDVLKYPDTSTTTVTNTLHEYLVMPIRDVLNEVQ